jgi:hypothetical protein
MDLLRGFVELHRMMATPYAERVVARTEPSENQGLGISTAWVTDLSCFETAILDANNAYPVERYADKDQAIAGHAKWLQASSTLVEVNRLGAEMWAAEDTIVTLQRIHP